MGEKIYEINSSSPNSKIVQIQKNVFRLIILEEAFSVVLHIPFDVQVVVHREKFLY